MLTGCLIPSRLRLRLCPGSKVIVMSDAAPQNHGFSFGRVLVLAVPLALVVWGANKIYSNNVQQEADARGQRTTLTGLFGGPIEAMTLDKKYKDADGDMLADAPAEADQQDPEEINFSYVATSADDDEEETWKEVIAALEENIGKKVNLVSYADTAEQMRALKSGDLHITAFSTGETEGAVNEAGFIPVACFANEAGEHSYTMKIIVPADSDIKEVKDVKGRRMTFVKPRSNSGCTAALVMLIDDHGLQPEIDYTWGFSYGHESSIKGIADKKFEAAAVASDILAREVAKGTITEDGFRVIYESDSFPPGVVGYAYNLKSDLKDSIRKTLLEFDWEGTGLEESFGKSGSVKFAEVDYKDDWKSVRAIQESGAKAINQLAAD
jgi:phosphonate transport system substrate-binding protein